MHVYIFRYFTPFAISCIIVTRVQIQEFILDQTLRFALAFLTTCLICTLLMPYWKYWIDLLTEMGLCGLCPRHKVTWWRSLLIPRLPLRK